MVQYRMNMTYHSVYRMFDGKPFFAPLKNPQRILDVGTGTGIWAFDVADQYPSAQGKTQTPPEASILIHVLSVVGVDLSPIQPPW